MKKIETRKDYIILILIAVFSYWAIHNLSFIGEFLTKIWAILLPFILGAVIAFVLNIPMNKIEKFLEKHIQNKNFPKRTISIILSLFIFVLIIAFVLFLLIPEVIENMKNLMVTLPSVLEKLETWIVDLLDKYPDIQKELQNIFANNNIETIIPKFLEYLVNGAIAFIGNLISGIVTLFTAIVFSIYILSQKEYLLRGIKKIITAYLKPSQSNRLMEIGKLSSQTFTKFISGQCVEAVILGTIFFIVLSICKFPYALLISVLTAITALIPIFGAMIAMVIGAILIAITNPIQAIIFIIVFQVIQQIENNFIYPKVVGKSVGLSPMWTLCAISIGGSLFGIVGMFTALPLASILYAILRDNVNERLKSKKK